MGNYRKTDARRKGAVSAVEKEKFLEVLASGRTQKAGYEAIGRHQRTMYDLRKKDEKFDAAWTEAIEAGTQAAEDALQRRTFEGYDEVMEEWRDGKLFRRTVNHRMNPSDLFFLLKARRPEVYRDNATVQVVGHEGGAIQVEGYTPPSWEDVMLKAVEYGVNLARTIDGEAKEDEPLGLESGG